MEQGNDVLVYVNGSAIAATRTDEIHTECGIIPIASPDTGDWDASLPGRKSWSINKGWLVVSTDYSADDLERLLLVGTIVTIRILGRGKTYGLTGSAIVRTCDVRGSRGTLASGSFAFQGTGALTKETPPTT